jgi:uncharacterized phage protein gp47/JayE
MALDDLPGEFITPKREEIVIKYKRDYALRNPDADVAEGSQPDLDARTEADTLVPVYSDARLIADGINEDDATGARLDRVGARYGKARGKKTGATGYVAVATASGGGNVEVGDALKNAATNIRYEAAETKHVNDGEHIRVRGFDKGPKTNVDAGVVLQWSSPRPGISQNATVVAQTDGSGLSGGADEESDERYRESIRKRRRNPPASGNDAHVIETIRETPDVPIEEVFTFAAVFGGGSHAFTFTTLPSEPGASRLPTAAQLETAYAYLVGQFPGDGSYFGMAIIASALDVIVGIDWDQEATGWADAVTWPPYYATTVGGGAPGAVVVTSATSATAFVLRTNNDDYTNVKQPVVGQHLAFWDSRVRPTGRVFRKKTILTVTGTGPWTVTCDTANGASDTSYTPVVGQRAMPWSDSLPDVEDAVVEAFDAFGPYELYATLPGDGRKQRRFPRPPKEFPQSFENQRVTNPVGIIDAVQAVTIKETVGSTTPAVGTPGVSVNLLTLGYVSVFPKT